jgi:hypothetical protein
MQVYFYLFYKLTRLLNKKGNNEMGPISAITLLGTINIVVIYSKILILSGNSLLSNYKLYFILLIVILFILNCKLFLDKKKVKEIIDKYGRESYKRSTFGFILVYLYISISLGLLLI